MLNIKKIYLGFLLGLFLYSFSTFLYGDNSVLTKSEAQDKIEAVNDLTPMAVPVLSPEEARRVNEEAVTAYEARIKEIQKQKFIKFAKYFVSITLLISLVLCMVLFKKKCRIFLLRFYNSIFGRLLYSTRFSAADLIGVVIVFCLTFFFSVLAGEKAIRDGYIGSWYANVAAPVALSLYNTGEAKTFAVEPDSKLDNFLKIETSLKSGKIRDQALLSISKEDAIPQKYAGPTFFYESTGLAWMIALWWKLVGYPDWSTIYFLFSLLNALIGVAAYCALRVVTGLLPAMFFSILLSSYPAMMQKVVFEIRDGIRALFCYMAIAVLIALLKSGFRWKKVIICSMVLFFICLFSKWIRQDFIVFIPFLIVATVFFHGKILQNYKKKLMILLCIVLGLILASHMPGIDKRDSAYYHNLYIGMADHPYMDYLHFSADNYTKGIVYSDMFGYIVAPSKAYRDRKDVNIPIRQTNKYGNELKKEFFNLLCLYPYDILRLALSSSIQNMYTGKRYSNSEQTWIESAPGYWFYQERSKAFYEGLPCWFYFVVLCMAMILFLGGKFYENMVLSLAILMISGCYVFQFDLRHYFYLMIIPLLASGFVFERVSRIFFVFIKNKKKALMFFKNNRKPYLVHCTIFSILAGFAFVVLFCAKCIQTKQINREIESFISAKTEEIEFKTNIVSSKINNKLEATEVLLPGFFDRTLNREDSNQLAFTDFLKVKFTVEGAEKDDKVSVFAKYEHTVNFRNLPLNVGYIVNSTRTCPARLSFSVNSGSNVIYMPIYYCRDSSPFIGIELVAEGKPIQIDSIERILETDNIRTQSAFLIPNNEKIKYAGNIDWNKVFWGEREL